MTKTLSFLKQLIRLVEVLLPFIILVFASIILKPILNPFHFNYEFKIIINELYIWLILILLYIYITKKKRQEFLLWKEKDYSFSFYILSVILIVLSIIAISLLFMLIFKLIGIELKTDSELLFRFLLILKSNKLLLFFVAITAGITEELLCRGYLMPRIELLYNKPSLTIIIPTLIFGLLHFDYGTFHQIIGPTMIGLIFALHYYKYRNIKILIFTHFLWDLIALWLNTQNIHT